MRRLAAAFLGVVALLAPGAAGAQSSELLAQIQALLAQISVLQEQIRTLQAAQSTASSAAAQSVCPTLSRTLTLGMSGEDVSSLQRFLGLQRFEIPITGEFDSVTEDAVRAWQSVHGLVSSGDAASTGWGVVGPRTRALIALNCDIQGSTPGATIYAPSCPLYAKPAKVCGITNVGTSSWRAIVGSNGCTSAWRCDMTGEQLGVPDVNSCTAVSLACPAGTRPRVGIGCSHTCVSDAAQSSCIPAPQPTNTCATGWRAVTNTEGCTTSYQCIFQP